MSMGRDRILKCRRKTTTKQADPIAKAMEDVSRAATGDWTVVQDYVKMAADKAGMGWLFDEIRNRS